MRVKGVETIYLAFLMAVVVIAAIGFAIAWSHMSSSGAAKQQFAGWAPGYVPKFNGTKMVLPDGARGTPGTAPTLIGYCTAYMAPDGPIVYSCPDAQHGVEFVLPDGRVSV